MPFSRFTVSREIFAPALKRYIIAKVKTAAKKKGRTSTRRRTALLHHVEKEIRPVAAAIECRMRELQHVKGGGERQAV
jgi:hypothetical protein